MGSYLEKFRKITRGITAIQPWKSKEISKRSPFFDLMSRISDEQPEVAGFQHIVGKGISLTKQGHLNGSDIINTEETIEIDPHAIKADFSFRYIDVIDVNLQKYMDYIKREQSKIFYVTALGSNMDLAKELKEDILREGIASLFWETNGYDEKSGKPYYFSALEKKERGVNDGSQKLLK